MLCSKQVYAACNKSVYYNGTLTVDCTNRNLAEIPTNLERQKVLELLFNQNRLGPILYADTFTHFAILRKLTLEDNNINKVLNATFCDLATLEYLSLFGNQISTLDNATFVSLKRLRYLNIGSNVFSTMPDVVLIPLTSLETLLMHQISQDRFQVNKLPGGLGASRFLKTLEMSSFIMPSFRDDFFDDLTNPGAMETIDFSADGIIDVSKNAFKNLTNLTNMTIKLNVDLNETVLSIILSSWSDASESKLKILSCCQSDIGAITNNMFKFVPRLEHLILNYLPITSIENGSFVQLTSLKSLSLVQTHLQQLSDDVFHGLHASLRYLDISNNPTLKDFSLSIANMTSLVSVDLSLNKALTIIRQHAFQGLHRLSKLAIYQCDLKSIENYTFYDMGSLTRLDLSENLNLTDLHPTSLRGLHNVTEVKLDDTNIEYIGPEHLMDMKMLTTFSAAYSSISSLPDNLFHNNKLLRYINLASNRLSNIDLTFQKCHHLEKLQLDGNNISSIAEHAFPVNNKLTYLDISSQVLNHVPMAVVNSLKGHLTYFAIHDNNITNFTKADMVFFNNRTLLNLDAYGNPFNCSCFIHDEFQNWFKWWNDPSNVKIGTSTRVLYQCKYPDNVKGHQLSQFNIHLCDRKLNLTWLTISTPCVLIILISTVLTVSYIKRFSLQYYWYLFWRLKRVDEDPAILDPNFEYDAYISHGHSSHYTVPEHCADYKFILDLIIPKMCRDASARPLHFAIDFARFIAGMDHCTQIVEFMLCSRKAVILLTTNYLSSPHGRYELEHAYNIQTNKRNYVVIIMIDDIQITDDTPILLKNDIKNKAYLQWTNDDIGQKLFWLRLREALLKP